MISGRMAEDGEAAIVPIAIMDNDNRLWPVEAVIDTGFIGDLALPSSIIRRLGLTRSGSINYILANGEPARMNIYRANVLWHEQIRNVVIAQTDDIPLIGIKLLSGSRITMDVSPNGEVVIEETE